jgi:predicted transcriptional regulator
MNSREGFDPIRVLERIKSEIGDYEVVETDYYGLDFFDLIDEELAGIYEREYVRLKNILRNREIGVNRRRSEMEIIASILNICRNNRSITKILHNANMSYKQLKNYIDFLIERGLLLKVGRTYSTTKKGLMFLILWTNLLLVLKK